MESVGLSSSSADDGAPSVSALLALVLLRPSASSDMPCTGKVGAPAEGTAACKP